MLRVESLDVPREVREVLIKEGIETLYPPQEEAIRVGVLKGRSLVMATPTASGKTLVAVLCALKHVIEEGGKVLYLTPLRALAWEKYEEFLRFSGIEKRNGGKVSVALSTGDYDSSNPWLGRYDIIVTTNEKCDSLLRHRTPWVSEVTLVVADEVHLIGSDRGPTLEVVLARLRQMRPDLQVLALSATIRNAEEVAEWLGAEVVSTEWRPVELREGVYYRDVVIFRDGSSYRLKPMHGKAPINLALNAVASGGQALIFVESRRRAMSMARETAEALKDLLPPRQLRALRRVADEVLIHGERTSIGDLLASCISMGAAFHHAGLRAEHRRIVEEAFREGKIKVIAATPTLAAGVNLPARLVVIANYRRFVPGYGMYPISVMEYKQMSGRAGRPQYDKFGEAVLIAESSEEQDYLMESYVLSKPERLYSRLASEAALRGHVLAAVASDYAHSEAGLLDFFSRTFYAYHYDPRGLRETIGSMLRFLSKEDMIRLEGEYLYATEFGRRVSELYIDPLSAVILRDGLRRRVERPTDLTYLHLICHTPDMSPVLRPRRNELVEVEVFLDEHRDELACRIPQPWEDEVEYEQFLGEVKTAMVLMGWIEELSENDLLERFNVQPGDRFRIVQNAEWLLYAAQELAAILKIRGLRGRLSRLRDRVKYGVKEELLPLVRLRGIGRVRARVLYNSGLRTLEDLKRVPLRRLVEIPLIGAGMAKRIKEQVGGVVEEEEWRRLSEREAEQRALTEFIEEEPPEEPPP
ncbi:DEAD/DEAH box helicase [Candidatus Bathyarchaeota archaeon]|nr:DEAD/DEAH box helicase [Candidatus Bathyarchaeota archaeon]